MVDGKIEMFTRRGKPFTIMSHIEQDLIDLFYHFRGVNELDGDTFYLDGELYSDTLTFQELAGIVRRSSNDEETLKQIHYVVFDSFNINSPNWKFESRYRQLVHVPDKYWTDSVRDIPTIPCIEEEHMFQCHTEFIRNGYEGTIIRNSDGIYKLNHRSSDLQKYKSFQDDEYEIIGFKEGKNTDEGCVIWECKTPNGLEFSVRPRGTKEQRTEWFDNGESYIGSLLTVRYQELTDDGIPRFPVGITIRDYE
jgi:DNA ligase-1